MIDLHCHILPGTDDGPNTLNEAIQMAKIAAADGIRKIVATPHIIEQFWSSKNKNQIHLAIQKKIDILNYCLNWLKIPMEIYQGAEITACLDPDWYDTFTINDSACLLVEFPETHIPPNAKGIIFRMLTKGYRPIIAHPERNHAFMKNPSALFNLLDENVLVQITAGSLTGASGPNSRHFSEYLLQKGIVHLMATDAHSIYHRPPILSEALKVATAIIGKEKATALVTTNPERILTAPEVNSCTRHPSGIPLFEKSSRNSSHKYFTHQP